MERNSITQRVSGHALADCDHRPGDLVPGHQGKVLHGSGAGAVVDVTPTDSGGTDSHDDIARTRLRVGQINLLERVPMLNDLECAHPIWTLRRSEEAWLT